MTDLHIFRTKIKERICKAITDIYLHIYGEHPNFEDGEEYLLDCEKCVQIDVKVSDLKGNVYIETQTIESFIATLDGNLFFDIEECCDELNYTDVNTDDLCRICMILETQYKLEIEEIVINKPEV